jgi:hypothetical protein
MSSRGLFPQRSSRTPSLTPSLLGVSALALGLAGCSGGSGFPDAPVVEPPATGRFSVDWTIADGDRVLPCAEVGGVLVSVIATSPDQGGGYVEAFSCGAGTGISRALPVGRYDLSFELKGRSGALVGLPFQQVTITADSVTPAPPQRFPVRAEGMIDARLVAGATANCVAGGGKITAMSLVLERQGGACVPAAFTIATATGPVVYNSTCPPAAPAVGPCIERNQAVSATLGSGGYVIRVRGDEGAAQCWIADQLEDVPPQQRTVRVDIGLTYLKGIAGCP